MVNPAVRNHRSARTPTEAAIDAGAFTSTTPGVAVPGMREQAQAVERIFVESDYAKLRACLVGNMASVNIPYPDAPQVAPMLEYQPRARALFARYAGQNLEYAAPEYYQVLKTQQDSLVEAYRRNGIEVIRNEGHCPAEVVNYKAGYTAERYLSIFGSQLGKVVGNLLISVHSPCASEASGLEHREAINELFEHDERLVWLNMPEYYPSQTGHGPGPICFANDLRVFPRHLVFGIGVPGPSHIDDRGKVRSSGDEFAAEVVRRMIEPFGWELSIVYYDCRRAASLGGGLALIDEGLLAMPKNLLWTRLPEAFRDWEVIEVSWEEHAMGATNLVPLGDKRVMLEARAKKLARSLANRGYIHVPIEYSDIHALGAGMHCSTMPLWRQDSA